MYENAIVQRNIDLLRQSGVHIVGPAKGPLACGDEGAGRLVEPEHVLDALRWALSQHDLEGETILITAGPTREAMDPVRFISNPSSGKMGYALAAAARRRGGKVILVSGPTNLDAPWGVTPVPVTTAREMLDAVMARFDESTVVIKAAAVSDWKPSRVLGHKGKKDHTETQWPFEKTEDILKILGEKKQDHFLVGFAAETNDVIQYAKEKLAAKHLDLVVANEVGVEGSGFATDTNRAYIIDKDGNTETLPLMEKAALADVILDRVVAIKSEM
jgi:phosphopantothenoylcysteine decarboxylase/phosphopantothenate--cysteine ligase